MTGPKILAHILRAPRIAAAALALAAALFGASVPAAADSDPIVRVESGALRGETHQGVRSFKNIPFAAPPTGALRWRAPEPASAWSGERDASKYGPACPQPSLPAGVGGGVPVRQDEDCLSLNVWTPEAATHLPVMVWIHGGAHRVGSGSYPIYDGTAFAQQGVILVTINYRLGLLGYFAHPALTSEAAPDAPLGNYGFLDQIAALGWVQKNIAAFGGDPGNVTLFGESAGGASALFLIASPRTKGLFAKAIVESGGGLQIPPTLAIEEQSGVAAMTRAGLSKDPTVTDMRALTATQVLAAAGPVQGIGFGPFIDGRAITEPPWRAFAERRAADIPLIIGANSNEASVLVALGAQASAVPAFAGERLGEMERAYGAPPLTVAEFARQALGDATFVAPARFIAAQEASGAHAYLYYFSYVATVRRDIAPGANHGSEIPYVFRTWDKIPIAAPFVSPQDLRYAAMMSGCWASFAKTGVPKCPGAPDWPAYDPTSDVWMSFGTEAKPETRLRGAQLDFVLDRLSQARR